MLYHLIVLLMNVVYRLGASVWMAYKLIGGVPSFVVDFRHGLYIDYGNKYEDFKKHDSP